MTALPIFNTTCEIGGNYSLSITGYLQIALSRVAGVPLSQIQAMGLSDTTMAAMVAEKCWHVNQARPYGDPQKVCC